MAGNQFRVSPAYSWDRLQHLRDPLEDRRIRKWMGGYFRISNKIPTKISNRPIAPPNPGAAHPEMGVIRVIYKGKKLVCVRERERVFVQMPD